GLNVVPYDGTRRGFVFRTGAYGDLTGHYFGARGRNVNGVAELNTYTTARSAAKSVGPSQATALGVVQRALVRRN
ncbi:MAG: hypothetical protein AABZ47_08540, partial [Planctomycetota bacterium]